MELCVSVKLLMIFKYSLIIFVLLSNSSVAYAEELRLLLITKENFKPLVFDKNELRRLFLGVPVYRNGKALQPLINKSEDLCYQVFLQSTLGMSQKRYERSLVSGVYRQGAKTPEIYTNFKKLLGDLNKKENAISFYYDHGQPIDKSLNIVQEIWISDE